jgi:hypothetical protein
VSYIDDLAGEVREHVAPELVPSGNVEVLFRIYAVLALAKGSDVELEDVHDAWSAWMVGRDPGHRSLRPLAELPLEVREADRPFLEAIHIVACARGLGR